MNKTIRYTVLMIVVGLVISSLLSVVNEITYPIIEEQKLKKVAASLMEVDSINKWQHSNNIIDISNDENIQDVYISIDENENYYMVGYLVITKGYSNGDIETLVFIDFQKKVINSIKIINMENQTKGIGSLIIDDPNYVKVYENQKIDKYVNDSIYNHNFDSVDVISGATISSRGVIQAVISACTNFVNKVG